jgi:chemotaxis protein methyltransferase CheR
MDLERMLVSPELEMLEFQLLLEGIYRHYGQDYRDYAPRSLKRRVLEIVQMEKLQTISALLERVLHDPKAMERFTFSLLIHVTEMFRDPDFFVAFRRQVVPLLSRSPWIRIWLAGCSTGEEVYSLAILLQEEDLYRRCRIYATDVSDRVLAKAKAGKFPMGLMQNFTRNYVRAGGKRSFSEYYVAKDDNAIFNPALMENVTYSRHNLVTDASFNEFDVIFCRNVLIYFNSGLQARVHRLLYESLAMEGVLGLGVKEMLRFSPHEDDYAPLAAAEKLFHKVR